MGRQEYASWHSPQFLMLPGDLFKTKLRTNSLPAFALALFLAPHLFAAGPSIQIPRIDRPPSLSDFGDMEPTAGIAGRMLKVTGFIVREPADGTQPSQNTDVYLAYDEHNCMRCSFVGIRNPTRFAPA